MTVRDLLLAASGYAAPSSTWINKLAGGTSPMLFTVAIAASGDVYVSGYDDDSNRNAVLIKFNQYGVLQWQKTLTATSHQQTKALAVDGNGDILIAGSDAGSSRTMLIARYSPDGTLISQQKSYTGTASATDIRCAASTVYDYNGAGAPAHLHDVVVVGFFTVTSYSAEAVMYKINLSGMFYRINLSGAVSVPDWFLSCAVDAATGDIFACGQTTPASYATGLITKYSAAGVLQWQRTLSLASTQVYAWGIALDSSANVYVGTENGTLVKYNSSGTLQWQRTLTGPGAYLSINSVAADASGNVYAFGYYYNSGWNTLFIAKYNSSGTIQWQRKITGTSGTVDAKSISLGPNNNFVIAAILNSSVPVVLSLPTDGSKTGTYDIATYATSSMTDAAGALTGATPTLTEGTFSDTFSTESYTDTSTSFTSTRTTI